MAAEAGVRAPVWPSPAAVARTVRFRDRRMSWRCALRSHPVRRIHLCTATASLTSQTSLSGNYNMLVINKNVESMPDRNKVQINGVQIERRMGINKDGGDS